jgi:tripeptide aminopeptidase
LQQHESKLADIASRVESGFPGARIEIEIAEQYRNMLDHLAAEPRAVEFALEAVRAAGIEPRLTSIRGGTDGSQLSAAGLPTPNLFAGGINFHSKYEWVAVPVMVKATETLLHLTRIWAERG